MNFLQKLNDYVNILYGFLGPNPWLRAMGILAVFWVLAYFARYFFGQVLRRFVAKSKSTVDDQIITLSRRPVFLSLIITGLIFASAQLPMAEQAKSFTSHFLLTMLVWFWLVFAIRLSYLLLEVFSAKDDRFGFIEPRTIPLLKNSLLIALIAIASYIALQIWNIDPTAWLASAGILGLALSFAAKDTLANLFAGVAILADAPYKIGDYVLLDSGERGIVTHVGIRSSRLLTRDDVEITIPNAVMATTKITNQSGGPHEKFRIRVPVDVAYGSDIDLVRKVLMDITKLEDLLVQDPAPRVRLRALGDYGIRVELMAWVNTPDLRGRAVDAVIERIYKRFMEENIEIPYPRHDITLLNHSSTTA